MAIYPLLILILCLYFMGYDCKTISNSSVVSVAENGDVNKPPVIQFNSTNQDKSNRSDSSGSGFLSGTVLTQVKLHSNGSAVSSGNKHWDDIVTTLLSQKVDLNTTSKGSKEKKIHKKFPLERYTCIECENHGCDNPLFCHNASQCYQARKRDSTGTETYLRGCIEKMDQIDFVCSSSYQMQVQAFSIKCCQGTLCNNETYPILPHPSAGQLGDSTPEMLIVVLYVVGVTLLLIVVLMLIIYWVMRLLYLKERSRYKLRKNFSQCPSMNPFAHMYRDNSKFSPIEDSNHRGMFNESVSSGSGSGLPLFVQRTLAKNIYLEDMVGKGRYGEVWKGIWHGETVAVKVFSTREESSWVRETEIFSSVLLRHENIIGFFGSDKTCRASCTQLWLVTHYYPNGSLFDYLQTRVLTHPELFTICSSIVNGLLHLHTEIMGTQGKPGVAHRALTSNNVLVKEDGTCCLSDFGLAVVRSPGPGEANVGSGDRSGTLLYTSPEMLDESMDLEMFDGYRKADIYALALVLWEACRRCQCHGIAEEYSRPFAHVLPPDPSYEEMRKCVCVRDIRPAVPNRWADDKSLWSIEKILSECWHRNPNVRLTALRIKKNLIKISTQHALDDVTGGKDPPV